MLIKSQQPSILKIDENGQENGDENFQIVTDEAENDNANQKQDDETLVGSNCSIM
jgi:hypothetical protein